MTRTADLVVRSFHAERVRTAGCSRLRVVFVPAAIAVPLGISVFIAVVAERFARIPGQVGILQVATSNAGYWVVSITVMVVAAAEVVISMLPASQHVRALYLGEQGVLAHASPGALLIDSSTIASHVAIEVAQAAQAKGCA